MSISDLVGFLHMTTAGPGPPVTTGWVTLESVQKGHREECGALVPWSVCQSLRSKDRSGAAASAEGREGQAQSGPAEKGSRVRPLVVAPDSSAARAFRSQLSAPPPSLKASQSLVGLTVWGRISPRGLEAVG